MYSIFLSHSFPINRAMTRRGVSLVHLALDPWCTTWSSSSTWWTLLHAALGPFTSAMNERYVSTWWLSDDRNRQISIHQLEKKNLEKNFMHSWWPTRSMGPKFSTSWNFLTQVVQSLKVESYSDRFTFGHRPLSLKILSIKFFLTSGFRYYCHYYCIIVENLTLNSHWHAMKSTHFEFLMYV